MRPRHPEHVAGVVSEVNRQLLLIVIPYTIVQDWQIKKRRQALFFDHATRVILCSAKV